MIVLDANILIRAVLGRRVRELIDAYAVRGVRFFAPNVAFADAEKYLPPLLKKRGKPNDISEVIGYLREIIEPVTPEIYAAFESEARLRLRGRDECWHPRSPWHVACGLETPISLVRESHFGQQVASRFFSRSRQS